jgi:hypothetical protein
MAQQQAPDLTKKTILYYPTITIPTGPWLRQALLYWDELGSIVPQDYTYGRKLVLYSPDIEWLTGEGVFRPFRPEAIGQGGGRIVDEFQSELVAAITSADFRKMLPPIKTRLLAARIHKDKVSDEIFSWLRKKRLAREEPRDDIWYYFEKKTALLYMAKLAKYLAAGAMEATVIGTDLREYEHLNFGASDPKNAVVSLTAGFQRVLPVPREDVSLGDILDFKRRRRDHFLHFRQMLNDIEDKLAACKSEVETKAAVAAFSTKLQASLTDLQAVLKDGKVATFWGSMECLLKASAPAWLSAAFVKAGVATTIATLPISCVIGGAGLVGSILVGKYLVDKRNERRTSMRQSQLSYFFEAKREGIIT